VSLKITCPIILGAQITLETYLKEMHGLHGVFLTRMAGYLVTTECKLCLIPEK